MSTDSDPSVDDSSVRDLTMQLGSQLSQLLRAEVALARAELFARARQAVTGGVLVGAAALLGLTGWLAVVAAGIAGVAQALPVWAAAAVIGGFLLLSALTLAVRGIRQLRSVPPLTLTAASLRRDAAAVKARAGQR